MTLNTAQVTAAGKKHEMSLCQIHLFSVKFSIFVFPFTFQALKVCESLKKKYYLESAHQIELLCSQF